LYVVDLTDANLTGADLRGANFYDASNYPTLTGADTRNVIWWAGAIDGLDLTAGESLVIRDYDGDPSRSLPPIDILVSQHVLMDPSSELQMIFDADAWDSTISFAPGIPVTLGGTLDLRFAPGIDVVAQAGRTLDLFDWTGVTPSGSFSVTGPYSWNLTKLYTTGEVTLGALPTWNVNASGNWSSAANWNSGGVPNGIDAIASFGAVITSSRIVTVDSPRTVGVVHFDSVFGYTIAGGSTLTLDVSSGQPAINVIAGGHMISAPLVLNKDTTITSAAGAGVALTGNLTASGKTITKAGAGSAQFENIRAAALHVAAGTARISPKSLANDAAGTSVVNDLDISAGAVLDLTNNSLVIDFTGPVGTLVLETRQNLASARLQSSSSDSTRRLGYADNAITGLGVFSGQSVDPTSILVKFTYAGDANLDGQVDIADLGSLATNWQQGGVWTDGDFNYDGLVNVADLGMLATNWQAGISNPLAPSFADALSQVGLPTSVPEPCTLTLLAIVLARFTSRRRTESCSTGSCE
jgi:hypothetical protein